MKKVTNSCAGVLISFSCFILSSEFIFSPLHKSGNIIISASTAILVGLTGLTIILKAFHKERSEYSAAPKLLAVISIISSAFSTVISLMLTTEVIKDTAYIANRSISMFYYISLSLAILTVSYYLCCNSEKGIYRFSILSSILFLLISVLIFSAFTTTKSAVFDTGTNTAKTLIGSVLRGTVTGLFLTADASCYFFCFNRFIREENGALKKNPIIVGYIFAFLIIILYNVITVLTFGTKLTSSLTDPDYALIKLIPGIDMTETISAIRIVSFMIKSSVYIYCSSKLLKSAFAKTGTSIAPFILIHYLMILIIVIVLTVIDKSLEYGAFQHLIYPSVIIYSALIMITNFLYRKKQ